MLYHTHPTLTVHTTHVLRCEPRADGTFGVKLADQLLYPEGGGQPSDHGWIAGMEVRALVREGGEIVHVVAGPAEGAVEVRLDAARRRDHREQHSGQHLLSAVAQDRFGLATTAFHLGGERSDIEVTAVEGAADVSPARMAALQDAVNELIREGRPVRAREVEVAEMATLPVRSRGLPAGHVGPVRLVEIEGVDLNTCGGTHVADTRELGLLAILGVERLGRATRLHFGVGGRVVRCLQQAQEREAALTRVLACAPAEHLGASQRLTDEAKALGKANRVLAAELASAIGATLAPSPGGPTGSLLLWHRDDADPAFLGGVADAVRAAFPEALLVLTGGAVEGVFLVAGPEAAVANIGPKVAETLGGRGGGARGKFQGKTPDVRRRGGLAAVLGAPAAGSAGAPTT